MSSILIHSFYRAPFIQDSSTKSLTNNQIGTMMQEKWMTRKCFRNSICGISWHGRERFKGGKMSWISSMVGVEKQKSTFKLKVAYHKQPLLSLCALADTWKADMCTLSLTWANSGCVQRWRHNCRPPALEWESSAEKYKIPGAQLMGSPKIK